MLHNPKHSTSNNWGNNKHMNIVESKLYFTTPPLSIRRFNQHKNLIDYKKDLDRATIYVIGKREVPVMRILEHSPIEDYIKEVDADHYVLLNIEMRKAGFNNDCVYVLPDDMKKSDFISSINNITIDEIFACLSHNIGAFGYVGDISPLISYEVLYVGQCVKEPLTKRFRAHHALQNMLIEENVISGNSDKADELILFPMFVDSDVISILTPDLGVEDYFKAFTNNYDFDSKEVTLDAEKALVHNMNPKYNRIKFKNYPKSDDVLDKTDANVFSYAIAEFAILNYSDGEIIGSPDPICASKIVGDAEGFTTVYRPGDDALSKYIPSIVGTEL